MTWFSFFTAEALQKKLDEPINQLSRKNQKYFFSINFICQLFLIFFNVHPLIGSTNYHGPRNFSVVPPDEPCALRPGRHEQPLFRGRILLLRPGGLWALKKGRFAAF